LADIRAKEMDAAMHIMGITQHHWLGYADGGCKQVSAQEAVAKLKKFIGQYQPNTILTFGPDGMTGHDDHRTVSAWVSQAVQGTDITVYHAVELRENYEAMQEPDAEFNIFFNIDKPPVVEKDECDLLLELEGDLLDQKYAALRAMPSQTEAMFNRFGHDTICRMVCSEAFVKAK
jgi:LmbE family N-acetylglucosaminyl deacetylase